MSIHISLFFAKNVGNRYQTNLGRTVTHFIWKEKSEAV